MRLKEDGSLFIIENKNIGAFVLLLVFVGIGFQIYTRQGSLSFIPVLLMVAPILVMPFIQKTKVVGDSSTQMLTISKISLVSKREKKIAFGDIARIEMRRRVSGSRGGRIFYPLYAKLKNGQDEKLIEDAGKRILFVDTSKDERETGKKLAEKIGVEFSEMKTASVGQLFGIIKEQMEKAKQAGNDTSTKNHF